MTAQPVSYKNMEAAIEAINNCDMSASLDVYREDYRNMFERFKNDGFIYQATNNDLVKTREERGTIPVLTTTEYDRCVCYLFANKPHFALSMISVTCSSEMMDNGVLTKLMV